MNPQELRIGNWVIDEDGQILPILAILREFVFHDDNVFSKISTIKPIHLTPEWLEKFGFKYDSINEKWKIDDYLKLSDDYYWGLYGETSWIKQLKYVHQLQNLYFAITGEELTIKHGNKQTSAQQSS